MPPWSRLSTGPLVSPPTPRQMSIRRPLASVAKIHPEHIAGIARDANDRGRFFMAFDGTIARIVEGWTPYERERRS